jgi:predicted oxidoreductase
MGWPNLRALPVVLLACACAEEPTFDERYDTARETIQETADKIEQDLKAAEIDAILIKDKDTVPPS